MQTNPATNPTSPATVAGCFANDTEAVARCFAEYIVVLDESHEHRGRADTGTFPDSPIDLRSDFTLEGGLIARLEIAP